MACLCGACTSRRSIGFRAGLNFDEFNDTQEAIGLPHVASYAFASNDSWVPAMSITLEALEVEVLRLPAVDRARLLDRVVASLDADSARDAAWDAVAARRDAEIDAGTAVEVPLDDVLARLRTELP